MLKYWLCLSGSVILSSISQVFLKKSALIQYKRPIKEYLNGYVIFGYILMVVSTILTILAFKGIEYKNGPVFESIGYILIMILSRIVFHEKITVKKVIGYIMILTGIVIFYM